MFGPTQLEVVDGFGPEPTKPRLTNMVAAVGFLKPAACPTATAESLVDPKIAAEMCSVTLPLKGCDAIFGASLAQNIHPCDQVRVTPGWEGNDFGGSKSSSSCLLDAQFSGGFLQYTDGCLHSDSASAFEIRSRQLPEQGHGQVLELAVASAKWALLFCFFVLFFGFPWVGAFWPLRGTGSD